MCGDNVVCVGAVVGVVRVMCVVEVLSVGVVSVGALCVCELMRGVCVLCVCVVGGIGGGG